MNSALFFSQNEQQEAEAVYAYEIYGLSLQADLVILSTCQSGSGSLVEHEGILSLGRAFNYAGCPNLIVTQWKMDDKASNSLMHSFLSLLKEVPIAEALKQAKLHYLETEDLAHPYYWGGWVFIGENEHIALQHTVYYPWLFAALLVGVIAFLLKKEGTIGPWSLLRSC